MFAWLRPNDLIWNYWVNNYLLGHAPKAFDILYWNADPVRMTAAMHRDFMELAICATALTQPGGATDARQPTSTSARSTRDSYVVAGIADHLCKWESCYRTTQLLGGETKFVLSTSGHIASMVNPPGNPKASFQTADREPAPTRRSGWRRRRKVKGSWWDDYVGWLAERTGPERNKPRRLGSAALRAGLRRAGHLCPRPLSPAATGAATGCAPSRCAASRCGSACGPAAAGSPTSRRCCCATGSAPASRRCSRFVDALDPDRGVIRFDVPGVGGSPAAAVPLLAAPRCRPG